MSIWMVKYFFADTKLIKYHIFAIFVHGTYIRLRFGIVKINFDYALAFCYICASHIYTPMSGQAHGKQRHGNANLKPFYK